MPDFSLPDLPVVPEHVAIIMDGNGRWAEKRHQPRLFGHRAGVKAVKIIVEAAQELGIQYLTLYAFSTENWNRPALEVTGLMTLLKRYLRDELENMLENDIRLACIGQRHKLPADVRKILELAIKETAHCQTLTMTLALSYGGRVELVDAVRLIADKCSKGIVNPQQINEELISDHLYTAGQPDPDLLIRTGGERRFSNFLLWQASYAELYFTELMWPEFGREQLIAAIVEFGRRQRRFGKTGAQAKIS